MKKLLVILIVLIAIALIAVNTGLLKKKQKESPAVIKKVVEKIAEKVTDVAKSEIVKEKPKPKRDLFTEPKILTKYREAKEQNQRLKAEITGLKQQIKTLQTEEPIEGPEDIEKINSRIAALYKRVEFLEAKQTEQAETQRYESEYLPEEELDYYEPAAMYHIWPYVDQYLRLYSWSMSPWFPYGIYSYIDWYWRYRPGYFMSYFSNYDGTRYSGSRTSVHKNQLKRRTSQTIQSRNTVGKTYSSRTSTKNIAKISGQYETPWGDIRSLKKSSSRISKSSSRIGSFSKAPSKSSSRSLSRSTTTRSTSRSSSGKVKKK